MSEGRVIEDHPSPSSTTRLRTPCGNMFVVVDAEAGQPSRVCIEFGKSGGCTPLWAEALGRVWTLALRAGADHNQIAKTLVDLSCDRANNNIDARNCWACLHQLGVVLSDDCQTSHS